MAAVNDWRQRRSIRARARTAELAAANSHYDADDLLRVMIADEFAGDLAIESSFGAEAVALLALAAEDAVGDLWSRQARACRYLRKVVPLVQAVTPDGAWVTGRKRYQGDGRSALAPIEASDGWVNINPLAAWTKQDVFALIVKRGLPKHPMLTQGYLSIGCQPCTRPVTALEDECIGRWAGQDKTR